jgi:diketogulonate reductase-like aldo/keto reductase
VENFKITDFELSPQEMQELDALRKEGVRTCWDPNSITY